MNGVSLVNASEEVKSIVQSMSAGALLTAVNRNKTSLLSKMSPCAMNLQTQLEVKRFARSLPPAEPHAILRSRECVQEGPRPHWTDRVFYDGKVYLSLERNDTWTAHVPQAMALKVLLDEQVELTRAERVRLQEGCIQLIRTLNLAEDLPGIYLFVSTDLFLFTVRFSCVVFFPPFSSFTISFASAVDLNCYSGFSWFNPFNLFYL